MGLHDLVDDSQSKSGSAFEVRLKRLKDFFDLLRRHAGSGIDERNLPIVAQRFDRRSQRSPVLHGADRILTQIPEHLLESVTIGDSPGLANGEAPLDGDS